MSKQPCLAAFVGLAMAAAGPAAATPFAALVPGYSSEIVGFDSASPGVLTATLTVTGLSANERLSAIATQPGTGTLYGVSSQGRIYTVNTATGGLTYIAASTIPIAPSGIAFDPATGMIHAISHAGQDLTIDPATGAAVSDGALHYGAGDRQAGSNPYLSDIRYASQPAAGGGTLFSLDLARGFLVTLDPLSGAVTTIGPAGVPFASGEGFEIIGGSTAFATSAFFGGTNFDSINLQTGAARVIGTLAIGNNLAISLAQAQIGAPAQHIAEPRSMAVLALGLMGLWGVRRRSTAASRKVQPQPDCLCPA